MLNFFFGFYVFDFVLVKRVLVLEFGSLLFDNVLIFDLHLGLLDLNRLHFALMFVPLGHSHLHLVLWLLLMPLGQLGQMQGVLHTLLDLAVQTAQELSRSWHVHRLQLRQELLFVWGLFADWYDPLGQTVLVNWTLLEFLCDLLDEQELLQFENGLEVGRLPRLLLGGWTHWPIYNRL